MPRRKNWRKSVVKKAPKADGDDSPGSQFSDVGLTHLTDHGGSVPQLGTSEPGSQNLSDVGMTCLSVSSDAYENHYEKHNENHYENHNENHYENHNENHSETYCLQNSDTSKYHTESYCLQNEFDSTRMNYDIEANKPEKESWNQTDITANSVDSKTIVHGSYNQADHMFSDQSRGSQCSINALCSLIFAKYSHLGTRQCLDKVLLEGDILYKKVISDLKAQGLFKSKLLTLDEIPEAVTVLEKDIVVEKFDVISGVCTQQFATLGLPSLYEALQIAFQKSSYLLFMIGSICSAVFKRKDCYCFF